MSVFCLVAEKNVVIKKKFSGFFGLLIISRMNLFRILFSVLSVIYAEASANKGKKHV